jgi:hypothetical protein
LLEWMSAKKEKEAAEEGLRPVSPWMRKKRG